MHGSVISVGEKKNRLLQPKAQKEVAAELSQTLPGKWEIRNTQVTALHLEGFISAVQM